MSRMLHPMLKIGLHEAALYDILERVSIYTGVPVDDMKSKSRLRKIVYARQLYMILAHKVMRHRYSLTEIGWPIRRDHATVIHGIRAQENLCETMEPHRQWVFNLLEQLYERLTPVERQNADYFARTHLIIKKQSRL